ncbi:MAG TPA: nuclear transport factor 2 family protein [Blastocatellia bacterium]|nr:nuclear transport factor 2 family protein [Blastocatellia bacterium]
MKRDFTKLCLTLAMMVFSVFALAQAPQRKEKESSDEQALAVVNELFDAMRAKDAEAIRALFIAEGQLVATSRRNNQPSIRVFTAEAFAKLISNQQGVLNERMYKPEVRVIGDLAIVSGRYGFYVDDRFSHCGTNAFHLMRTSEGWKIVNAASTIEPENCEPESKEKK